MISNDKSPTRLKVINDSNSNYSLAMSPNLQEPSFCLVQKK